MYSLEHDLDGHFRFDRVFPLVLPPWAQEAVARHDWRGLIDAVVRECTSLVFSSNRDDEVFAEAFLGSVSENAAALRDVLCGTSSFDDVPLRNRLRFAALQAELRIPQASLQRSYRISFFLQWQEWTQILMRAAAEADVDRTEALQAQATLTVVLNAYSDHVISSVASNFARSEEAVNRSRAHVRQRLVRGILEGADEPLSPADLLTLDYGLDASHVAVLLPSTPQGAANQLLVGLRAAVRPTWTMVYPTTMSSSVIWLGSMSTPWPARSLAAVVDVLESAGVVAALGDVHAGPAGFVRTYEQAQSVEAVRTAAAEDDSSGVLRYADLRLEILLLQNPLLAGEFLAEELGPLAQHTSEAAKLRTTLEASFRFGSHVAAAQHLQLHEHTVRNRLQKAEDVLGPLHERRTEIQVALRLHRMLAEEPAAVPPVALLAPVLANRPSPAARSVVR